MRKTWLVAALLAGAAVAHAEGKKELVAKLLQLQRPGIEAMAGQMAQAPVLQMLQEARTVIVTQVPPERREAVGKAVQDDARKFVDDAAPLIRERAIALAPSTIGTLLEEKFSEEELKQLIAWFDSPLNRKYQQLRPDMDNGLGQKLATELAPVFDPKLAELRKKMQADLVAPAAAAPGKPASK